MMEVKTITKTLNEVLKFAKVGSTRVGGKKLDFAPVLAKIIESGQPVTVNGVTTAKDLVNGVLSRQRVYKLLDKASKTDKSPLIKLSYPGEQATYYLSRKVWNARNKK